MKRMMLCFLLLFLVNGVQACVLYPKRFHLAGPRLIETTESIILAKVVRSGVGDKNNSYWFSTVEILKGKPTDGFGLTVDNALPGYTKHKGVHDQYAFWTHLVGGTVIDSDCNMRPNFRLGHQYLIFNSSEYSMLSHEEILSSDDRWLRYVREYTTATKKTPIFKARDFLGQFDTIQTYSCPSKFSRVKPTLIKTYKGEKTSQKIWPTFEIQKCFSGNKQILLLDSSARNGSIPYITLLYENGVAKLNKISNGVDIVESNRLTEEDLNTLNIQ